MPVIGVVLHKHGGRAAVANESLRPLQHSHLRALNVHLHRGHACTGAPTVNQRIERRHRHAITLGAAGSIVGRRGYCAVVGRLRHLHASTPVGVAAKGDGRENLRRRARAECTNTRMQQPRIRRHRLEKQPMEAGREQRQGKGADVGTEVHKAAAWRGRQRPRNGADDLSAGRFVLAVCPPPVTQQPARDKAIRFWRVHKHLRRREGEVRRREAAQVGDERRVARARGQGGRCLAGEGARPNRSVLAWYHLGTRRRQLSALCWLGVSAVLTYLGTRSEDRARQGSDWVALPLLRSARYCMQTRSHIRHFSPRQ